MSEYEYDHGYDCGYDNGHEDGRNAVIAEVCGHLGLSIDTPRDQIMDAIKGVRQAAPVRDESVPPPGYRWDDEDCAEGETIVDGRGRRYVIRDNADVPLDVAWAQYDAEHGYAPMAADLGLARLEIQRLEAEVLELRAATVQPSPAPAWKVGDRVTVLVDTPVPEIGTIIPPGTIGTVTEIFDADCVGVAWPGTRMWWMNPKTLSPAPERERDWDAELQGLGVELRAMLGDAGLLEDAARFQDLVCRSMGLLGLTDGDVAEVLPVSRSAVSRWRHGVSVPLPMMRRPVYEMLLRRVVLGVRSRVLGG